MVTTSEKGRSLYSLASAALGSGLAYPAGAAGAPRVAADVGGLVAAHVGQRQALAVAQGRRCHAARLAVGGQRDVEVLRDVPSRLEPAFVDDRRAGRRRRSAWRGTRCRACNPTTAATAHHGHSFRRLELRQPSARAGASTSRSTIELPWIDAASSSSAPGGEPISPSSVWKTRRSGRGSGCGMLGKRGSRRSAVAISFASVGSISHTR